MTKPYYDQSRQEAPSKRGDDTRQALIMAGLKLFGEHGFKSTSTRMLADESGANIAAIPYHFGSKLGLYKAVMEYISARLNAFFGQSRKEIKSLLDVGEIDKNVAKEKVVHLLGIAAELFVGSTEARTWSQIILREQASPSEAFDIFYNSQVKPTQTLLTKLIAVCLDLDPEDNEAKIRGHALFGQVLGFMVSRENLFRHLGVREFTSEHVTLIKDILLAHNQAFLRTDLKGDFS